MTTSSFWVDDLGLESRPPLSGDADCDLVVIGSGIAGLSSAYEAARFGWRSSSSTGTRPSAAS